MIQIARTVVALTAVVAAQIHITPAKANQCGNNMSGSDCYKAILASAGATEKYISYFGSEVAVVNFARIVGNNACAAVINSSMSSNDALQSTMGQYRPQLISMGMSQSEADFLTASAVNAGTVVDCPTHINRSIEANRPRTTGITPR